jgi:hypothetical protein
MVWASPQRRRWTLVQVRRWPIVMRCRSTTTRLVAITLPKSAIVSAIDRSMKPA